MVATSVMPAVGKWVGVAKKGGWNVHLGGPAPIESVEVARVKAKGWTTLIGLDKTEVDSVSAFWEQIGIEWSSSLFLGKSGAGTMIEEINPVFDVIL